MTYVLGEREITLWLPRGPENLSPYEQQNLLGLF